MPYTYQRNYAYAEMTPQVRNIASMSIDEARDHMIQLKRELDALQRYRNLVGSEVYRDMLEKGAVWKTAGRSIKDIKLLSLRNLQGLKKWFSRQPPTACRGVAPLYQALMALPYTLKHNTKPRYEPQILGGHYIISKTEIEKRKRAERGGTVTKDDDHFIHNEDFVFFRLAIGRTPAVSRFGVRQKDSTVVSTCFVFDAAELFKCGWVSLHDMLNPTASHSMVTFPQINTLTTPIKGQRGAFVKNLRVSDASNWKSGIHNIRHKYPQSRQVREMHRVDEVFYGPDIREGIALSVIQELVLMGQPAVLREAIAQCGNVTSMANLVFNLFRPEAKFPRQFHFKMGELLAVHRNVVWSSKGVID